MSEFKKVFRGYDESQVSEKIASLENELTGANGKIERLETTISELVANKVALENKVKELEEKLQKAADEQKAIIKKMEGVSLPQEALATIYSRAYESGEQLALSPKGHIEALLADITGISSKTKLEFEN